MLAVAGHERHTDAGRFVAELLEGHTARRQLIAECRVDVTAEEVLAQPEAHGEIEDDPQVGTCLAAWSSEGPAQLD